VQHSEGSVEPTANGFCVRTVRRDREGLHLITIILPLHLIFLLILLPLLFSFSSFLLLFFFFSSFSSSFST